MKNTFLDSVKTKKKYLLSKTIFRKKTFGSFFSSDQNAVTDVGQNAVFSFLVQMPRAVYLDLKCQKCYKFKNVDYCFRYPKLLNFFNSVK